MLGWQPMMVYATCLAVTLYASESGDQHQPQCLKPGVEKLFYFIQFMHLSNMTFNVLDSTYIEMQHYGNGIANQLKASALSGTAVFLFSLQQ